MWDGLGYIHENRGVDIPRYPVRWTILLLILLFTNGFAGDKGII
jgi:hypothetical protein